MKNKFTKISEGTQRDKYDLLYKNAEFKDVDLSDFKITDGKEIKNKKILVLGIGTARDIKYLLKNNEVWGIDSSEPAVEYCQTLGIKAFVIDIEKKDLSFNNGYFDIVVVKDILEHISNPLRLMKSIGKLLKPSGYVVVSVHNHFYFPFRLKILFGGNMIWKTIGHDHTKLFKEWNYMHKIFFTWKGFQEFLKESGFHITKTFWDLGTLGHYSQPETVVSYIDQTWSNSLKKHVVLGIMKSGWRVFNFVFPKKIRSKIVDTNPAIFSAGFYVFCKK